MTVTGISRDADARVAVVTFDPDADMERVLTMGMEEGITVAMHQMDALL